MTEFGIPVKEELQHMFGTPDEVAVAAARGAIALEQAEFDPTVPASTIKAHAECKEMYDAWRVDHAARETDLFTAMGIAELRSQTWSKSSHSSWHLETVRKSSDDDPLVQLAHSVSLMTDKGGLASSISVTSYVVHPAKRQTGPLTNVMYFKGELLGEVAFIGNGMPAQIDKEDVVPTAFDNIDQAIRTESENQARTEVLSRLVGDFMTHCAVEPPSEARPAFAVSRPTVGDLLTKQPKDEAEALAILEAGFSPRGIDSFLHLLTENLKPLSRDLVEAGIVERFSWLTGILMQVRRDIRDATGARIAMDFEPEFAAYMAAERRKTERVKHIIQKLQGMRLITHCAPTTKRPDGF